ncbi:MAG: DUF3341 domain-containing protein [Leptospiraceae bacterium]|nr:DUF3341 domain-containing protein [Leptospiraceae bacterium]MCB1317845.1 DUF3341 domain-containing protein [Leptospiraceae bacterium]
MSRLNNMDAQMEKLAGKLDVWFQKPVDAFFNLLDRLFDYTYRETEHGMFGLFDTPEKISKAAKAAHAKGYTNFDCLTPFPVHGLEFDMGLKRSKIPYITFFAGLTGMMTGFLLQFIVHEQVIPPLLPYFDAYANLRSYPMNIGGKPTFSWPAMVPIVFELTVLIGGHTTVAGLIMLAKMFRPFRKVLHPDITNDKFCLWIPTDSSGYNEDGVRQFLSELGATDISKVTDGEAQSAGGGTVTAGTPVPGGGAG